MMAIPKKLLIHEVFLVKKGEADRWGAAKDEEKVKISKVRIEPSSKVVRDKNKAEVQLDATLFFDCKNSRAQGYELKKDDILEFSSERYRIETIESLYDEKKLHHYEMGLVKGV